MNNRLLKVIETYSAPLQLQDQPTSKQPIA